jgi:hypothetical protein
VSEPLPRDLAVDPEWLPHTFGRDGTELTFVHVPRAEHDRLMFLSDEHYQGGFTKRTEPAAAIAAEIGAAPTAPMHFIFHTAFCASTLLVRAFDIPGRTVGIKEPDVLINLANRLVRADDAGNRDRLRLVLKLLSRPFAPGDTVIVKPTNFANRLMVPALEEMPGANAVLLYSDLATLLRSLAKRGMWGRIWARKLYRSVAAWTKLDLGYDAGELFELTDLQVAGLAWLMQISHFDQVARGMQGRTKVIDSAEFLADPARTLGDVARLFELDLGAEEIEAIGSGPVFGRHSKFSQRDYSVEAREAEHDATIAAHGEEIDMVVKWVEAVAGHCRAPLRPGAGA